MTAFLSVNSIFNNREIAVFFWILAFCLLLLTKEWGRKVFVDLFEALKILWSKWIVTSIFALFAFTFLIVIILYKVNFWHLTNLKETIFWVCGVALVMLAKSDKVSDENYFKNTLLRNFKIVIILEFLVKLYVFSLWIELILVPFVTLIMLLQVVPVSDHKSVATKKFLGTVQGIFGILLLVYISYNVINDFGGFATWGHFEELLLPIILTIAYLPFIYLIALAYSYQGLFVRLRIFNEDEEIVKFAKKKILLKFHFDLKKLVRWRKGRGFIKVSTKQEILDLLNEE